VPQTGGVTGGVTAVAWDGWPESEALAILGLDHSSLPRQIMAFWPARAQAAISVGWRFHWSEVGIPEYEAKLMKGASSPRGYCCRFIATTPNGLKSLEEDLEETGAEDISSDWRGSSDYVPAIVPVLGLI